MRNSTRFYFISIGLSVLMGIINGFLFPKIMHGESIFDGYYLGFFTTSTIIIGAIVLLSYYYIQNNYIKKKNLKKSYI